jgi:hypothetical protein
VSVSRDEERKKERKSRTIDGIKIFHCIEALWRGGGRSVSVHVYAWQLFLYGSYLYANDVIYICDEGTM